MPTTAICPECDARLTLRKAPVEGARLKCTECSARFEYTEPSDSEDPAPKKSSKSAKTAAISAGAPARRKLDPDDDADRSDESDEEEERRPRKKKKKDKTASKTGLIIGLAVGGGGLLVLGIVAVVVAFFVLRGRPGNAQAKVKAAEEKVIEPAVLPVKAGKPIAPVGGKPNDPVPVAQPPKILGPADLYGDQGGEQVAAADAGLPSTVMRARRDDTFFKLSNPREGQVKAPDAKGKGIRIVNALLIDYVVVHRGKLDGGILVIHTDDGRRAEVPLNFVAGRDQGTIELVGVSSSFFGKKTQVNSKAEFPKNVEFYVTRGDNRYVPPAKFMVSNSAVMGELKVVTRARDWTAEELDRYGKPPPAYMTPNLHLTLGEDIPSLNGWPWKNRFVEPDGRLLGLDYDMGAWAGQKRISGLVPIFSQDQPKSKSMRELAKPGYAVAGAEANMDKDNYIFGIRLLFRRIKADKSLDAADAYAGEWIGAPPAAAPKVLANDGRRVMGMTYQSAAVIDRFSLVVAR